MKYQVINRTMLDKGFNDYYLEEFDTEIEAERYITELQIVDASLGINDMYEIIILGEM